MDDELSLAELLQVVHRPALAAAWLRVPGRARRHGRHRGDHAGLRRPRALVIEPDGGRTGATVATPSQTPDSASVDSQVQILASRSLAREVIAALGLAATPS